MTDPNLTAIALIQDRSGSMGEIRRDAEGALNQFLDDQRQLDGEVLLTFARFNEGYELVHLNKPLQRVEPIVLEPRGLTALLDAVGLTITKLGGSLAAMDEDKRPSKVLVAIVTDGLENSSKEYTREQVFDLITEQREKWNWEFIFLAANQDAIVEGARLGVAAGASVTFAATSEGVRLAGSKASVYAGSFRSTGKGSFEDHGDPDGG